VFHGAVELRYYAVIPESEDPWGRLPLALYRAELIERDDWWWEQLDYLRGWHRIAGRPEPGSALLRELTRTEAQEVLDDWKSLQIAGPWLHLEDGTTPSNPAPLEPVHEPMSRSARWQWRIFGVAMLITVAVIVLKNIG
jgi:hypothetical protein